MSTKSELSKMKVTDLKKMAEDMGIESSSKMLKAQLIKAIIQKEKKQATKPSKEKLEPSIQIEKVNGIFVNYRQGMFRQRTQDALIRIDGVTSIGAASKYIGRKVIWQSHTGKRLIGKVISTHGLGGILLSRFRKGLPGQAIGSTIEII